MTSIVSTKEKTFTFVNEFDVMDTSFYIIDVKVEEKLYSNGKTFYDISYSYKFEGSEESRLNLHPFYNDKTIVDEAEGVIVYKNKMTEMMIEYLLLDSEELKKVSNITSAQCYRASIMLSLNPLWD